MEIINGIKIFLLAMTPVGELRLSIPMGLIAYNFSPFSVYFISLFGNLVPAFFILLLLSPISDFLSKKSVLFYRFFSFLFSKTRKNHSSRIKKYGFLALVTFVAIPLPITGVWTASLAAFVFGIPFKKAFPLISLGAAIAGIVVLFIIKAGIAIESYFGWQTLLGIIMVFLFVFLLYKSKKNGKDVFHIFKKIGIMEE
ncbi:MAG: small multi-drug export protein [Candidatus Pacebacteria bacterium]|jgi:uncharacterized membrane protein|nr:small multi-drug export protein [Candidatus Paceibacterota bacterium]MDD3072670.1 small multi-drug export protein [Candidatus Paceibacterota bacterium]MDD3728954.1 small multi-drug export protein [Candidatus Paceibacterota bacterium]MDD4201764.1 small multi-drug export protein [Candidatus Paceibacterota bacterium]MDD4466981.1 small multi-drug export protein [Candidatus Paceibacterota bacterium]